MSDATRDRDRDRDRAAAPGDSPGRAASGDFFRELSVPLLAHELKGPLAVIESGVVTALERGVAGADPARLERTLRRVLRSARRAQALIDDLLEIGRAEAGQLERSPFRPADELIAAVIDAVEAMDSDLADRVAAASGDPLPALEAGGVEVRIAEGARSIVMEQDRRKLALIVANLVRNALRFRRSRVVVALEVEGGVALVSVEDDGPGVAPEDRERIFERWARGADAATGSRQGHGLGLAAARVLARGMGGDVALAEGAASRFVLTVPVVAPG
jgi:signal transduction histidine kinase